MEFGSGDIGLPGDKYRIRLRIAGKYRDLASDISVSAHGCSKRQATHTGTVQQPGRAQEQEGQC